MKFAEKRDTGLIAISTHGMSSVERILLGSIAQRIISHAPRSAFVVNPHGTSPVPAG